MLPLWVTIALGVAPYLAPPLIGVVVVLVKRAEQHLPAQKRELLDQISRVVVPAVEQTASALMNGPAKKQLAMEQAAVILQHLGVKQVDPTVLSSFLEAAVKAQKLTQDSQVLTTVQSPMSNVSTPNG